jgi:8-oxo-dGTP diphosphatase
VKVEIPVSNSESVSVTAAVIVRDGRVLVARRPPGGRHPGSWEFPGGKQEPGETLEECLAREMNEEMGVEVTVSERVASVHHSYPDLEIDLIAFRCEISFGELADIGCAAHDWVEPERLAGLDLLPPDRVLARMIFPERSG